MRFVTLLTAGLLTATSARAQSPAITTEPASRLVFAGQAVSLNVVAQGAQPLSYQWIFNGTTLGGQTNAVLSFPAASTTNAGTYAVVVSNSSGSVTSSPPAELIVAAPIANNQVWPTGSTITLDPGNSLGAWQYQWQHNGTNVSGNLVLTVAGQGGAGFAGDGGAATNAKVNSPAGIAVDSVGDVFIADYFNSLIRRVDTNGTITTVAGLVANGDISWGYSGDGYAATNAQLDNPEGVAVDAAGDLFIADSGNNVIRKVDTNGIITTVAGNGIIGYSGDGGAATNAQLALPTGVAVDSAGNLFVADFYNSLIRKVDTNGTITIFAGRLTNGSPTYGYSGDGGAATNALLDGPFSVAMDGAGNLIFADTDNNCVRKVDTNGIITTVAGNGHGGYSGDGIAATNTTLTLPACVAPDAAGELFISDNVNQRIRKVDPRGIITTFAGNGTTGYSGDGGVATDAVLNSAEGIAVDAHANVLFADSGNNRIRKVIGAALTLQNVTTNDTGGYRLIVTGPFGSVTSSVVTLSVLRPTINIMPMGDSVTARGAAPESSYRYWLYTYLTNAGFSNTMFVGSQAGGTSDGPPSNSWPQMSYEGGSTTNGSTPVADGWTSYDGVDDASNAAVVLNKGNPGAAIVLLDLGANDYIPGSGPMAPALAQMRTNLDLIIQTFYDANPNTVVLLAVPTPWVINPPDPITKQFMSALGSAIGKAARDQKKAGVKVVVVNLRGGFNPIADTRDGTHPNVQGEQLIAKKYFNALRPILKNMEQQGL